MGKKIKKAVKKVTKIVKKSADPAGVLGGGDDKVREAPTPEAAPTPAQVVEAPKEDSNEESDSDTEAARKAARARGKRGLSVARSSGTGLNI